MVQSIEPVGKCVVVSCNRIINGNSMDDYNDFRNRNVQELGFQTLKQTGCFSLCSHTFSGGGLVNQGEMVMNIPTVQLSVVLGKTR